MKKINFKLFNIFLIFFANLIAADIYADSFKVFNNKRLNEKTILHYLKQLKDIDYVDDAESRKLILDKLFNIGLFNNIETQYHRGVILISPEEAPVITNISLKGNKKFKSKDIFNAIFSKSGATFSKSNIDLDILLLQNLYTQKNSYLLNVKTEAVKVNDLAVELKYEIEEGPNSYVKNIYFIGLKNANISEVFLRTILSSKRASLINRVLNMPNYDPMKIEQDRKTIISLLQAKGFIDATVNAIITNVNAAKQEFNITFYITEGKQYIFNSIKLTNNTSIPISIDQKWLKKGEIFNKSQLDSIIEFVKKKLSENGYPNVQIVDEIKKDNDKLNIELVIDNAQKYYIDEVLIFNNLKTKTPLILRKANIKEGNIYDSKDISQGVRRLMGTGYFHNVTPDAQLKDNGKVQVKLRIEERSTANLGIKFTFDDKKDGTCNLSFGEKNLLGTGFGIDANIGITTQKSVTGSISAIKPYLFDLDMEGSASFSYANKSITKENALTDILGTGKENYNRKTTKFASGVSYSVLDSVFHLVQYGFKINHLYLSDEEKTKATNNGDIISQYELGTIYTSSILNKLIVDLSPDKPFNDTSSSLILSLEIAGIGGDAKFAKGEFEYKFVKQIKDETHFKFKLNGGLMSKYGDYKLKVDDKFVLDIRGFDSTGPRLDRVKILGEEAVIELNKNDQSKDQEETKGLLLNGEYYFLISAQVDRLLVLNELFKLSAGPFIDAGFIGGCDDENYKDKFLDSGSIKASLGVEAIVSTQFFEFRTGIAYEIKKGPEDKEKVFYFKMGAEW